MLHDDRQALTHIVHVSKRQHISNIPPPTIPYFPPLVRHRPPLPSALRARLRLILTHTLQNRIVPREPSHVFQSDPPPRTRRLLAQTHIQKRYSACIAFSDRTSRARYVFASQSEPVPIRRPRLSQVIFKELVESTPGGTDKSAQAFQSHSAFPHCTSLREEACDSPVE